MLCVFGLSWIINHWGFKRQICMCEDAYEVVIGLTVGDEMPTICAKTGWDVVPTSFSLCRHSCGLVILAHTFCLPSCEQSAIQNLSLADLISSRKPGRTNTQKEDTGAQQQHSSDLAILKGY